MNQTKTEIKYGRIEYEGKIVGYATYQVGNDEIELISIPYGGLYVKINGQMKYQPGDEGITPYVMIWTKVAGWLGADQLLRKLGA